MKRALVVVILIIALVVGAFLIIPMLAGLMGPLTANMSGQWYYEGEKVGEPFAFYAGDQKVDELRVTVSWTATGVDVDETSFGLGGSMSVFLRLAASDELLQVRTWTGSGADDMQGSHKEVFMLNTLLSDYMDLKASGWTFVIKAHLGATVNDIDTGEAKSASWDGSITYTVDWVEGEFTLTGNVGV